jgi:hypothetical protein
MLRRVTLVRIDVSEELGALALAFLSSPILVTLMMETLSSPETPIITRATRRNIPEDAILHSHRREHLKSYNTNFSFEIYKKYNHVAFSQTKRMHADDVAVN